jgi:HlyD family secretion protein
MKKLVIPFLGVLCMFVSCTNDQAASDAFGNFESISVMVAAESPGRLVSLSIEECQKLALNQDVAMIDTMPLHLKREQLLAAIKTMSTKSATITAQIESMEIQLMTVDKEFQRIISLLNDGASTQKQKDDIEGRILLLKSQKEALKTQNATIKAEKESLMVQIDQVDDQINRSVLSNPIEGIVLQKYKQEGEIVAPGQAIYKIANLDKLILRAYISGNQLSSVKIGQKLKVRIDGANGIEEMDGLVRWISSQAEFTPKIIQTREERVNLVYAIKVEVENDGRIKIGMPGEIKL